MSFFQSTEAGVTSSTSQAMKLPICSRYSLLALSRVTQNDLLIDGGTTTVRTLESWAHSGVARGDTGIFITPGFDFKLVDLLVTNFHLPKSSLMMLVSAFAGYGHIMALYREAIARQYRFFSYGDAMLLARSK